MGNMGRMHGIEKGKSSSFLPYNKSPSEWIVKNVEKIRSFSIIILRSLSIKGKTPSKIGNILRDIYAIPQARFVYGHKIEKILKIIGLKAHIPEDITSLIA